MQSKLLVDDKGATIQAAIGNALLSLQMKVTTDEKVRSVIKFIINDTLYTDFRFINETNVFAKVVLTWLEFMNCN